MGYILCIIWTLVLLNIIAHYRRKVFTLQSQLKAEEIHNKVRAKELKRIRQPFIEDSAIYSDLSKLIRHIELSIK